MLGNILQKSESHRRKIALASTFFIFMLIAGVWGNMRGFLGNSTQVDEAPAITVEVARPAKPTKAIGNSFSGVLRELTKQFDSFKESLASVFVPFITGIEVYDSSGK